MVHRYLPKSWPMRHARSSWPTFSPAKTSPATRSLQRGATQVETLQRSTTVDRMRRLTPLETIELREQLEDICRRYGLVIANDSDDPAARARETALSELRVASLLETFSKAHVSEAALEAAVKGATTADIASMTGASKPSGWERWRKTTPRPDVLWMVDDREFW